MCRVQQIIWHKWHKKPVIICFTDYSLVIADAHNIFRTFIHLVVNLLNPPELAD